MIKKKEKELNDKKDPQLENTWFLPQTLLVQI